MTFFFKAHYLCQDSQYCTRQILARNKGNTSIFLVFRCRKFLPPCAEHTIPPGTNSVLPPKKSHKGRIKSKEVEEALHFRCITGEFGNIEGGWTAGIIGGGSFVAFGCSFPTRVDFCYFAKQIHQPTFRSFFIAFSFDGRVTTHSAKAG